jgi:thiol-disulfide isomerase/thioredoxin
MSQAPIVCDDGRVCCGGFQFAILIAICTLAAARMPNAFAAEPQLQAPPAPPFAGVSRWLNTNPLTIESQRGKVVVLHFWTFGCVNCQHNLPYYNRWRHDYAEKDVQIIGVHTPETTDEADAQQVAAHVKQLGIEYPVAIDGDHATWDAYKNRVWPSIFLIDKRGRIRDRWDGELEYQEAGGDKRLRSEIQELLAEAQP